MRTRTFLRTSEFLWQEGHTAHAEKEEAVERAYMMLDVYERFVEDYLAMPVIKGEKTASERFPGAVDTLCIESMMQDRKALQAGTSHFLGQNFSRASDIRFQSPEEKEEYAWTTSWGVSTRMIGGLIMTHGDDDGIILPPRIASGHIVLLPIFRNEKDRQTVMQYTENLAKTLREKLYYGRPVTVEIDSREIGGARGWEWIKKGIPIRVEIGPRDIAKNSVFVARRDRGIREKQSIPREQFVSQLIDILDDIQKNLFDRALEFREKHTVQMDEKEEFVDFFTPANEEKPEIHGGFSLSHWCGRDECETRIKEDLKVTIRCIPFGNESEPGGCVYCGGKSSKRVMFAKAY
jgi:prolyl-tRNA synthetase